MLLFTGQGIRARDGVTIAPSAPSCVKVPEGAADIARRAADIIEERGHAQGRLQGDDGSVCTWAALTLAQDPVNTLTTWLSITPVHAAYGAFLGWEGDICAYNNTHTATEVTAKLREFADSL